LLPSILRVRLRRICGDCLFNHMSGVALTGSPDNHHVIFIATAKAGGGSGSKAQKNPKTRLIFFDFRFR